MIVDATGIDNHWRLSFRGITKYVQTYKQTAPLLLVSGPILQRYDSIVQHTCLSSKIP